MPRPVQILSILVLLSTAAAAEPAKPAPDTAEIGFGIHIGKILCRDEGSSNCGSVMGGLGVDAHLRRFLRPDLGVVLEVFHMAQGGDYWAFRQTIGTVGVAWRPDPALTLTGGLGGAVARVDYKEGWEGKPDVKAAAPAVMVSAALAVLRGEHTSLDLQLRGGLGLYTRDDNDDGDPDLAGFSLGTGVAVNWF